MLIPGCAETETRPEPNDFYQLLEPLHLLLTTSADPNPREITAMAAIESFAKSSDPLWISAEVGGGSAWIAQALYERSGTTGTFLRQDCDASAPAVIPEGQGMLVLSNIERLEPHHQEQLAATLKRNDMRHLEGLRTIPPAPRVVAWSTQPLQTLVRSGRIHPSLAQAFARVSIVIPPLREQAAGIGAFAAAALGQVAAHDGVMNRQLSPAALAVLESYDWPGNLSELYSMLERTCLLADPSRTQIEVGDLPADLQTSSRPAQPVAPVAPAPGRPSAHQPRTMQQIEAEAIRAAIHHNNGNLVRAARELRIGRATLYRKLKKYGIPTRSERRQMMQ